MIKLGRRRFLIGGGVILAGGYTYQRGLRYPRLGFEHRAHDSNHSLHGFGLHSDHCIVTAATDASITLRAFTPEPRIRLTADTTQTKLTLQINNIDTRAQLKVDAPPRSTIHEQVDGINRIVEILSPEKSISLSWYLPNSNIDFAVIGDTGGNVELDWCINRAATLGARFLLHLGDFNYADGEYQRAIAQFEKSPIPIYVSIGNHDYNASGLIYDQFLNHIGPLNHSFTLADTRFVNLDTAADFFPAHSGNRGRLVKQLLKDQTAYSDTVVFTHRVVKDPRPNEDHDIGGIGEIDWLCRSIKQLGGNTLLTGHVHRSAELKYKGVRQLTAGEGLGHEDIVHQKQVSKILMGSVRSGQKVEYQWHELIMPWLSHQSPTHRIKLIKNKHYKQLEWYKNLLNSL